MGEKVIKKKKRKGIRRAGNIMILFLSLLLGCTVNTRAAMLPEAAAPEGTVSMNTVQEMPEKEAWGSGHAYVYEKDFGQDFYLKGLFDRGQMYFNVGQWDVAEAAFILEMNSSQIINTGVSYFTVFLNSRPVYTGSLAGMGGAVTRIVIPLPAEALQTDAVNGITVEAYLRGQTTDACVDDSNIAAWMNISKASKVLLSYEPVSECANIAQFYQKFLSIEALDNKQSLVGTSKDAGAGVLTAMAHILSGISAGAVLDYDRIQIGLIESRADISKYPYLIYVNTYEQLPEYIRSGMSALQKKYAVEGAVVCLTEQEGTKILVISGNDEEALINAGIMLSNADYMEAAFQTEKKVDSKEDFYTEPYEFEEYVYLTALGAEVKGNFEQKATFSVDCPSNRTMASSSQLSLDFRYSDNLDFDKSLLTVLINGIPIGSRKLSEEGAPESAEVFDIPGDLQISGGFTVDIVFMLYPEEDWCELTPEEIPWGYIADTSMIKLYTKENTELYFEKYPAPFIEDGIYKDTRILLPAEWTEADLKTMAGVLLTMGRYQKSNRGSLAVMVNPEPAQLDDLNLISIGEKGKNLISITGIPDSPHSGAAQLSASPYGETIHSILTVSGGSGSGMQNTLAFLGDEAQLWELKGDMFVTDGEVLNCYYKNAPEPEPESPADKRPEEKEENLPLLSIGAVLVLILMAAIMLLMKYGRKQKNDES